MTNLKFKTEFTVTAQLSVTFKTTILLTNIYSVKSQQLEKLYFIRFVT